MSWSDFPSFIQNAVLTTAWVSLLLILVLLLRKPFATRFGAKAAYALWLLPLARFVTPPLPQGWSLSGLLGLARTARPDDRMALERSEQIALAPYPPPALTGLEDPSTALNTAIPAVAEPLTQGLSSALFAQIPLILLLTWIAGTIVWLGRSFYQQHSFLRLIADDSEPASAEIYARTRHLAAQMGLRRVPAIRISLLCSGPLVTGLTSPIILLPLWFEEDYSAAEQKDALIHELMHVRRHDLWAFQLARIIAATQWFNPLVHPILKAFRTDQEAACDADVISRARLSPADYGRTLVKAARLARPADRRLAVASLTLAHPIKERLIMMTHPVPSLRQRLFGGSLAVTLGAAAIFATAGTTSIAQELDGASDDSPARQTEKSVDLSFSFDLDDLPPMPPLPELPPIPGMSMTQDGTHFSMTFDSDLVDLSDADMAEFTAKMEAWSEKMEAWSDRVDDRAADWAEGVEPHIEALERDIENWAGHIELMAEHAAARAEKAEHRRRSKVYDGVTEPEIRDFGNQAFNKIEIGSGLKVVYSQDPKASVTAELRRGKWQDVEIKVSDDTLKIGRKGSGSWGRRGIDLTVYASSKTLTSIDAASGSVFEGSLVARDLSVDASSGSNLSLEGTCNRLDVDASSGSNIRLSTFACKSAKIDASSGSNIRVHASKSVDADASSGSSIQVTGNPGTVKKEASSGASIRIG